MEKKGFKLGLLPKILIAIVVGILIGQFLPVWFCRIVVTASSIFSTFLKFIIPLMIVAYVTMGIADLKSGAGKLLLITVALAYTSTLVFGSASYLISSSLFPHFMSEGAMDQIAATAGVSLDSYISISIPPILDTMSAVVLAFENIKSLYELALFLLSFLLLRKFKLNPIVLVLTFGIWGIAYANLFGA